MDKLIPMQENLGLGHKGNILITTQKRINTNLPPITNNVINEEYARRLCQNVNCAEQVKKLQGQIDRLSLQLVDMASAQLALQIELDELKAVR